MTDLNITEIDARQLPEFAPGIREAVHCAFQCPGYEDDVMADLQSRSAPVMQLCLDRAGQVAGFAYGYMVPAGTFGETMKIPPDTLPSSLLKADRQGRVGVLKTIVTTPSCQGSGVGTKLVHAIEQGLIDRQAAQLVVPAWKAGTRINIDGLMKKTGYDPGLTIDGFWQAECDSGAFDCVDRAHRCICSAVFYTKDLAERTA